MNRKLKRHNEKENKSISSLNFETTTKKEEEENFVHEDYPVI